MCDYARVDNEFINQPDDDNKATVKGVHEVDDEDEVVEKPVKSADTGDNAELYVWSLIMLMAALAAVLTVIIRRRESR